MIKNNRQTETSVIRKKCCTLKYRYTETLWKNTYSLSCGANKSSCPNTVIAKSTGSNSIGHIKRTVESWIRKWKIQANALKRDCRRCRGPLFVVGDCCQKKKRSVGALNDCRCCSKKEKKRRERINEIMELGWRVICWYCLLTWSQDDTQKENNARGRESGAKIKGDARKIRKEGSRSLLQQLKRHF